jgi:hypothetical protein
VKIDRYPPFIGITQKRHERKRIPNIGSHPDAFTLGQDAKVGGIGRLVLERYWH